MNLAACFLIALEVEHETTARSALRLAFPGSVITTVDALDEALAMPPAPGIELLVLAQPGKKQLDQAVDTLDSTGLKRWATVVLGDAGPVEGVEIVPPGECNQSVLARAFKSAVAQHGLRRDNARLCGDLRSVAYRITHDLRTPLGGLLSTAEALKDVLEELDPPSLGFTSALFDSVEDLRRLIDQVGVVTRATANPLAKSRLEMEEVVWSVLQRLERRLLQKGIAVNQPSDWPAVAGVAQWLEAVWGNLLANAVQHSRNSASIELGWRRHDQEFRFWVRNEGDEVAADKISLLFQPFHQMHRPGASDGLGLSIVQRLMELQGGTCGYEPAAGGGSNFFFTLPDMECSGESEDSRILETMVKALSPRSTASNPDLQRVPDS